MRTARMVLVLFVAVLIASPLLAKEKKAAKPAPCPADQHITKMTEGLTVTDDQKAKFGALKKEFGPKLVDALKAANVYTPEQKKAMAEAEKKAKADGKKGKELRDAVTAAVTLTAEQKAKKAEADKVVAALRKDLNKATMDILTADQKAALKKKADEAKKAKK